MGEEEPTSTLYHPRSGVSHSAITWPPGEHLTETASVIATVATSEYPLGLDQLTKLTCTKDELDYPITLLYRTIPVIDQLKYLTRDAAQVHAVSANLLAEPDMDESSSDHPETHTKAGEFAASRTDVDVSDLSSVFEFFNKVSLFAGRQLARSLSSLSYIVAHGVEADDVSELPGNVPEESAKSYAPSIGISDRFDDDHPFARGTSTPELLDSISENGQLDRLHAQLDEERARSAQLATERDSLTARVQELTTLLENAHVDVSSDAHQTSHAVRTRTATNVRGTKRKFVSPILATSPSPRAASAAATSVAAPVAAHDSMEMQKLERIIADLERELLRAKEANAELCEKNHTLNRTIAEQRSEFRKFRAEARARAQEVVREEVGGRDMWILDTRRVARTIQMKTRQLCTLARKIETELGNGEDRVTPRHSELEDLFTFFDKSLNEFDHARILAEVDRVLGVSPCGARTGDTDSPATSLAATTRSMHGGSVSVAPTNRTTTPTIPQTSHVLKLNLISEQRMQSNRAATARKDEISQIRLDALRREKRDVRRRKALLMRTNFDVEDRPAAQPRVWSELPRDKITPPKDLKFKRPLVGAFVPVPDVEALILRIEREAGVNTNSAVPTSHEWWQAE